MYIDTSEEATGLLGDSVDQYRCDSCRISAENYLWDRKTSALSVRALSLQSQEKIASALIQQISKWI